MNYKKIPGILSSKGRNILWSNQPESDAETWLETKDIINLSIQGPCITIHYVSEGIGNFQIDEESIFDIKNGEFKSLYVTSNNTNLDITNGQIKDLRALTNVSLNFTNDAITPKMLFTDSVGGEPIVMFLSFGSSIINNSSSPIIDLEPGKFMIVGASNSGFFEASNSAVVRMQTGSILFSINSGSTQPGNVLKDNSIISDDNSALLVFGHDGNFTGFPNLPKFSGVMLNMPLTLNGGSGPTIARPSTGFKPLVAGMFYFDTDIDKQIHLNNSLNWVDNNENLV